MSQQVEINCGTYTATLTGRNVEFFKRVSEHKFIKGKRGEDLVSAFLCVATDGISEISRCKNDKLNNGSGGQAAHQMFNDKGVLFYAARYRNGSCEDGAKGLAAIQRFNDSGVLIRAERYKNGKLNDASDGSEAIILFDDNGEVIKGQSWKGGLFVKEVTKREINDRLEETRKKKFKSVIEKRCPGLKIL